MNDIHFYIIIAVYNVEKYLPECIDSILAQTYQNYYVVLVDDGSPDRSGEICDAYAAKDSRIHVIHQKNTGVLGAREAGIHYSKSVAAEEDFFVFADSDDLLKPNALETISRTIRQDGSDMVIYCSADLYPNGQEVPVNPQQMPFGVVTDKRTLYRTVFTNAGYNQMWRKAVSRRLFGDEDYSEYYESVRTGEDLLESIPLFLRCRKASFIKDILYCYRMNPTSLTNTHSFDKYNTQQFMRQIVWDAMKSEGVWQEEDYSAYKNAYKADLRQTIWMIGKFFVPIHRKKEKFEEIRQLPINMEILRETSWKEWDLHLTANGWDVPICLAGSCLGAARFFYRKLKTRRQ